MLHVYSQPFVIDNQTVGEQASKQAECVSTMYEKFGIDISQSQSQTIMRLISNGNNCESNVSFDDKQESNLCTSMSCPNTFLNPLTLKPLGHHFSLAKTFPILAPLSISILNFEFDKL